MSLTSRRNFIKFLGAGAYTLSSVSFLQALNAYAKVKPPFTGLSPSFKDDLTLAKGLNYYKLISWKDKISKNDTFGFNNDYIEIHQLPNSKDEMLMWVNHEYVNPLFINGKKRTQENIDKERYEVGGSIIKIKKNKDKWSLVQDSPYNRRITGKTPIPFANGVSIMGKKEAIGTLGNCAGGKTPWGTFLTCEENFQDFYGKRSKKTGKVNKSSSKLKWNKFYNNPPEHYGWVVEVNPFTGEAKKHTNLGRFSHESATCAQGKTKKAVVYSGDDKSNQFLYKFISSSKDNFDQGTLYVADIKNGQWLALDREKSPLLKERFNSHLEMMIHCREAGKILGATPLNRPEDIEINHKTKAIFVSLTNNKKSDVMDFHGSILKIEETNQDHESLTFKASEFFIGGEEGQLSCPDNLAFDQRGNLWVASDISGGAIGKAPYKKFGNNGLFVIPTQGVSAGVPIQIASAPNDAELTGLKFTPDYKTLFVSVQHPGEQSKDLNNPTSRWPDGGIPKSTVVAIYGPLLEKIAKA